jgi:hypothetical protein
LLEGRCTLLIIVLIDVLQVKVERLGFQKRSSQYPSSLRGGIFINPLEQLLTWSFEVDADLGETRALAVNWVPAAKGNRLKCGKGSPEAVVID